MIEGHTGDRTKLPALILELVEQGRDQPAIVGDVHAVIIRLDPADQLAGALGRVGVSMQDTAGGLHTRPVDGVGRLSLEIAGCLGAEWAKGPGGGSSNPRVVTAAETLRWDHDR